MKTKYGRRFDEIKTKIRLFVPVFLYGDRQAKHSYISSYDLILYKERNISYFYFYTSPASSFSFA